jgi:hypothetical protein
MHYQHAAIQVVVKASFVFAQDKLRQSQGEREDLISVALEME